MTIIQYFAALLAMGALLAYLVRTTHPSCVSDTRASSSRFPFKRTRERDVAPATTTTTVVSRASMRPR
jgi:hypothetical protein